MNKLLALPLIALAAASGSTAFAQSSPDFQFSGVIMLEGVFPSSSPSITAGFADIELDYAFATLGSGTQIGVSLDYLALQSDVFDLDLVHGGLYADFGNQRLTVGVPNSAFATHRGRSVISTSGLYGVQVGMISITRYADLIQMFVDKYAFGARYDGQFGAFDVSASFQKADFGGADYEALAVSAKYTFSEAFSVWASSSTEGFAGIQISGMAAGLTGNAGAFEYSLTYSDNLTGGDTIDASAFYAVNDNLEIGLGTTVLRDGIIEVLHSATVEYTIADRYFARASVFGDTTGSPSGAVSIGVEF